MKVYLFILDDVYDQFKYRGLLNTEIPDSYDKTIYAVTTEKRFAKEFVKLRNMNIFHEEIFEMSMSEFSSFMRIYNRCAIDRVSLTSCSLVGDTYESKEVFALMTSSEQYELESVIASNTFTMFDKYAIEPNPISFLSNMKGINVFKRKYQNILNGFFMLESTMDIILCPWESDEKLEYLVDELAVYISIFQNTYK